ncbi:type 1 glutamine amidotransferase domain-containing protein [Demequina muriae]|uniref:Type 1 glutamine amidotransferase domain-containing protein n=1 Tax=Demequina muriae TaxID=3051664 RepID=A0ABT8GGJ7_9MICO|nr:type 1 glutamine amidotransferase domain-containing protein [Demequina sp. EGI L300058]MDN4480566.1 type 1 glutamine amidotransferase domain-containing protein [Demequina sp. EGI L300058]
MSALIITTNYGVEQDELKMPLEALRNAGVPVTLAATEYSPVQSLVGDKDPGETFEPDTLLADVEMGDYAVLVIPGGTINADNLRTDDAALALVRTFAGDGRTIASICHGPWLLAEADVARGKSLTSYESIATDLRNAGATWEDVELRRCEEEGWTLLTSRNPGDLDAFSPAVVEAAR